MSAPTERKLQNLVSRLFSRVGISVSSYDAERENERTNYRRYSALYDKYRHHTMVPKLMFHDNLSVAEMAYELEGDIVECGVWKGGMIAAISEALDGTRKSWLFDSFEGLPPASDIDGAAAKKWQQNTSHPEYYDNCRAAPDDAREAMDLSGTKNAAIVKGWFDKTVPHADILKIAVLRLDGDWYDSTRVCLDHLYQKVTDGGIVIIDDYYFWDGCARAVHDFLSENGIADRIRETKHGVAYIVKNKSINQFA